MINYHVIISSPNYFSRAVKAARWTFISVDRNSSKVNNIMAPVPLKWNIIYICNNNICFNFKLIIYFTFQVKSLGHILQCTLIVTDCQRKMLAMWICLHCPDIGIIQCFCVKLSQNILYIWHESFIALSFSIYLLQVVPLHRSLSLVSQSTCWPKNTNKHTLFIT